MLNIKVCLHIWAHSLDYMYKIFIHVCKVKSAKFPEWMSQELMMPWPMGESIGIWYLLCEGKLIFLKWCEHWEAIYFLVHDPIPRYTQAAVQRLWDHKTRICERKAMGGSNRKTERGVNYIKHVAINIKSYV